MTGSATGASAPPHPGPREPAVSPGRLASLDAFRGFDILTMVFVNAIAGMAGIPFILRHAPATMDAYTLTDLVFPGFLFIVGVSIPLALARRIAARQPVRSLAGHLILRTLALLFLGVIQVNHERFSAAATGMSGDLWYFLAYAAVFAIWASVPRDAGPARKTLISGSKIAAAVLLVVLVVIFRGQGPDGAVTWLRHSWWGILGMIGWTYLAGSLVYIACRGNRVFLAAGIGFTAALYIGSRHGALDFLGPFNRFLEHGAGSIFGSHTSVVLAGILAGTLFLPGSEVRKPGARLRFLSVMGAVLLLAGYLLRPLHGFSKIAGTESWALASAGICTLALALFYAVLDVAGWKRAASFLIPAGRNPLLAYLLPDQIGYALLLLGGLLHLDLWRVLWPFAEKGGLAGMLNAAVVTALVLLITALCTRAGFILRL